MRTLLSVLFASLFACASVAGEPLLSQGIGASRCGDLVADIKDKGILNPIVLYDDGSGTKILEVAAGMW